MYSFIVIILFYSSCVLKFLPLLWALLVVYLQCIYVVNFLRTDSTMYCTILHCWSFMSVLNTVTYVYCSCRACTPLLFLQVVVVLVVLVVGCYCDYCSYDDYTNSSVMILRSFSGVARNLRQGVCKVVLPLPSLPLPSPPLFPFLPIRSRPLKYSWVVWGSAVNSPSGVCGGAPAEIDFGAF